MMGNKVIEQIVNPFIRIAGMKALDRKSVV